MKNKILILLALTFLGTATAAAPLEAKGRCRRYHRHHRHRCRSNKIGTAIGSFIVGAIVGSAISSSKDKCCTRETVYVETPCQPPCGERVYVETSPGCYQEGIRTSEGIYTRESTPVVYKARPAPRRVEYYY